MLNFGNTSSDENGDIVDKSKRVKIIIEKEIPNVHPKNVKNNFEFKFWSKMNNFFF